MIKRLHLTIFILIISFPLFGQSTLQQTIQQEKRIALVIGNGNYIGSILANPENDAKAIKNVLLKSGFEVLEYENLKQGQIKKAIDDFGMKLKNYDVGLFFYAGHGMQSRGLNYLIPVDADLQTEAQVEYDCVQADRVLALMEESGAKVKIVILDACRNNPFERSWSRSSSGKGLATMNAPSGTLIAYSTAPGSTASDGSGKNSLYTTALLENIIRPDIPILQMFQTVRATVSQKSSNGQVPWEATSLIGDFYFNPKNVTVQGELRELQIIPVISLPGVSAPEILNITAIEANLKATVDEDGGANIVTRGMCYSTSKEPTIISSKTVEGEGTGSFSSSLSRLAPNKTYYVRAYAINSAGIGYSAQVSFKTDPAKPIITTVEVSKITSTSSFAEGNISDDGGAKILVRGICWSTSSNPTIKDNKTEDGGGLGTFTTPVIDLLPDTTYYLRAYCSNDTETHYGNELIFNTLKSNQVVDIDDNIYNSVRFLDQIWMTENLKTSKLNDGTPIPQIIDKIAWKKQESPSYCWYDNQEAYKVTYGALYNWQAVNTGKLCPVGWHVSSDTEWDKLLKFISSIIPLDYLKEQVGVYLKEQGLKHWEKPNKGFNTIYSCFAALPGGFRDEIGEFKEIGMEGYWWSFFDNLSSTYWYHQMGYNSGEVFRKNSKYKPIGLSVRCIKDN
jgi:uncharacterized protein (TIGR02145 family)